MTERVRIVLNRDGFRQIARSAGVARELLRRGAKVAAAARAEAPPHQLVDTSTYIGRNRVRVTIIAPFGLASDRETRWLGRAITAARE